MNERSSELREFIITRAFRIVLGRSPDPEGLARYTEELRAGMSIKSLLDDLKSSQEYKDRFASGMQKQNQRWQDNIDETSLPQQKILK